MTRRQQFVAFVVVLAVTAGAHELWNHANRRQSDAVTCIEGKGGKVHREWPENTEIVEVGFIGPQFTDEDVKLLKYFPSLRVVAFVKTSVTYEAWQAFQNDRRDVTVAIG